MGVVSFVRGVPAPECLPVSELADCARAAIEADGTSVLSYGPGGGYAPLRAWIAERHGVEPARVVITSGSLRGRVPVLIPKVPVGSVIGAPCAAARLAATDPLANQVNTLPSIGADCQIAIRPDLSRRVLREHSRLGLIVDALRHETRIAVER